MTREAETWKEKKKLCLSLAGVDKVWGIDPAVLDKFTKHRGALSSLSHSLEELFYQYTRNSVATHMRVLHHWNIWKKKIKSLVLVNPPLPTPYFKRHILFHKMVQFSLLHSMYKHFTITSPTDSLLWLMAVIHFKQLELWKGKLLTLWQFLTRNH